MANVKISALSAATKPVSGDQFVLVQGGSTLKVDWDDVATSVVTAVDDAVIASSKWSTPAASTTRITFSDTTGLEVGDPLKVTINSIAAYYIITLVSTNSHIDVAGPTMDTGQTLNSIKALTKSRVVQYDIFFPGLFANGGATTTLVARELRTLLRWSRPKAYLVYAAARQDFADTDSGNQAIINVQLNGTDAFTGNIALPDATTFVISTAATADVSNYTIAFTQEINVDLVTAAGNLDARDLTITLTFVLD